MNRRGLLRGLLATAATVVALVSVFPLPTYTTTPAPGATVVRADIQDLRNAVIAIGG